MIALVFLCLCAQEVVAWPAPQINVRNAYTFRISNAFGLTEQTTEGRIVDTFVSETGEGVVGYRFVQYGSTSVRLTELLWREGKLVERLPPSSLLQPALLPCPSVEPLVLDLVERNGAGIIRLGSPFDELVGGAVLTKETVRKTSGVVAVTHTVGRDVSGERGSFGRFEWSVDCKTKALLSEAAYAIRRDIADYEEVTWKKQIVETRALSLEEGEVALRQYLVIHAFFSQVGRDPMLARQLAFAGLEDAGIMQAVDDVASRGESRLQSFVHKVGQ